MKKLLNLLKFLVLSLYMVSCVHSAWNNTDDKTEEKKPQIKSCKIYSYQIDKKNNMEEGVLMEEFEYDKYGNQTKLVRYDSAGNVICTFNYKYDKAGNLTEKIWKEAGEKKENHIRSTTYTYDLDGSAKRHIDSGRNLKYDQSGKLIERIWSDPLKKSEIKETHHYYEGGKQREVQYFNEENELEKRTVYSYDSIGNEISMIDFAKDGKIESKITYVYDEYGNIKEDIYWDINDSVPYQIVKYIYEFY